MSEQDVSEQELSEAVVDETEAARLRVAAEGLLAFARGSRHPDGGFGWLDDQGDLTPGKGVETWITARMTHCFALGTIVGDSSLEAYVDHGVQALLGPLRDEVNGGWHSGVLDGQPIVAGDAPIKEGYAHAFVVLAATSAVAAGRPDAEALLAQALEVMEQRFWREDDGMIVDVCSGDWSTVDPYRGVNANMHAVEAFLAVAEVTGDRVWLQRAVRIIERVVHGFARDHDWRLPEHFDEHWQVDLDYNIDEPAHPFRPYGVTIGHLLEWSRLALHARTLLGEDAPGWLAEDAQALNRAAVARGWHADGADGFVYTTDFADTPVVRERMHWVVTEAIATAWTLHRDLAEPDAWEQYERWWAYAEAYLVDHEHGSWRHELDPTNRPSALVWAGKPDVYHAYQATILPLLPASASFAGAALKAAR